MHGIMYHHFHRHGEPMAQGSITADEFAAMLEFLGRHNILPAQEWYERAITNKLKPNEICLTFDDTLMAQYDIARPVMESMGLTGFFFIYSAVCEGQLENLEIYRVFRTEHFKTVDEFYTAFESSLHETFPVYNFDAELKRFDPQTYLAQFPFYTAADKRFRFIRDQLLGTEKYDQVMDAMIQRAGLEKTDLATGLWMSNEQLRTLAQAGHMIGLHSYSHPTRFQAFDVEKQAEEYGRNFTHISKATGIKPVSMSHPCNSYNSDTLHVLRDLGIKLGFCANMSHVANRSALEFPREDHANVMKKLRA